MDGMPAVDNWRRLAAAVVSYAVAGIDCASLTVQEQLNRNWQIMISNCRLFTSR
jgi:hypothetical protein